jgi:hypothetical protein
MKSGSNYKMSKQLKTSLALGKFKDAHARGQWKRAMIEAELTVAVQPRREKSRNAQVGA